MFSPEQLLEGGALPLVGTGVGGEVVAADKTESVYSALNTSFYRAITLKREVM